MEYSLLKDVSNTADDWRVHVRIARLWEHRDAAKGNDLICLHLVLVDEKADGIHGLIPKGLIAKFQPLLQEGHVYYLQYMKVVPVTRSYRTTYHGFELRFTAWTNVVKIDPVSDAFPLYAYRLRSIRDIASTVTDKTYLADVIGLINGVSALTEVDVKGTRTPKRNLRITDGRDTAILTLWGDNATQIDADELVRRGHQKPVIVIAMGCTFKIQSSMVALTGSYGSKICLNLANSDVTTFRNRITGMDHSVELIAKKTRRLAMNEVEQTTVTYLEGSHHARMHMLQRRGRPPPGITTVSTLLLHQSSILQYFTSTNRLHQESRTRPFHLFAAAQSQNVDLADLPQDTSTATGTVLEIQSEIRNITDAAQRSSTPPGSVLDTSAADMLDKVKDKESRPKRGRTSGAKSSASKKLFVEGNDAASHGMDK